MSKSCGSSFFFVIHFCGVCSDSLNIYFILVFFYVLFEWNIFFCLSSKSSVFDLSPPFIPFVKVRSRWSLFSLAASRPHIHSASFFASAQYKIFKFFHQRLVPLPPFIYNKISIYSHVRPLYRTFTYEFIRSLISSNQHLASFSLSS